MTPKDWFGLALRFAGIWCGLQSAAHVMSFIDARMRLGSERQITAYGEQSTIPQAYLLYAIGYAVLALLLVLRTDFFIRLSFRPTEPAPPAEDDSYPRTSPKPDSEI